MVLKWSFTSDTGDIYVVYIIRECVYAKIDMINNIAYRWPLVLSSLRQVTSHGARSNRQVSTRHT